MRFGAGCLLSGASVVSFWEYEFPACRVRIFGGKVLKEDKVQTAQYVKTFYTL